MPQLSLETFVTQYFWLVIFLFTNYLLSATLYLPRFSEIFKLRKYLESSDFILSDINISNKGSTILSEVFKGYSFSSDITQFDSIFHSANNNWINSNS